MGEALSLIKGTINCLSIQTVILKRTTYLDEYRWYSLYEKKKLHSKKEQGKICGLSYFYEIERFFTFQ